MAGKVVEYKKISENGITWWERKSTCGKVSVTFTRLGGKPNIYFDKYATSKFQSKYVVFGESEDRVYFKESTEKVGTRLCTGDNSTSQMSTTVESTELFKQIAGRKTLMYDFDIGAYYVEKNESE